MMMKMAKHVQSQISIISRLIANPEGTFVIFQEYPGAAAAMATYYHQQGSEIQATDGLQTLVLMNPSYVQYSNSNAPPPPPSSATSSLVFLNSAGGGTFSHHHTQQAQASQTQQFVGIPLSAASQDPGSHSVHMAHEISPLHGLIPRGQYNLWNPTAAMDPSGRETPRSSQQGLSLSLSSQNPGGFRSFNRTDTQPSQGPASGGGSPSSASGVTNGVSGFQSVLLSSKYLKATQELLEEVVNVGNGMKLDSPTKKSDNHGRPNKSTAGDSSSPVTPQPKEEVSLKSSAELSTAERQEIQMKKAKLINMLDEVEQRYRQYHHQMQIVISSFEQAAGIGSAKTYTSLALQTISKQFRCLKDAIAGQIRSANKSLGEEESPAGRIEGSRLKFVDHHLRQQRALQQLGVMQHNAWRPQRGLPERSVSILRAWLFEHFLHPYPKDSDKHMLAKQTGLTRSQVSNWFINARVRLWKPMVEEMYTEEMKEHEKNNGADEKTSKSTEHNEDLTSKLSPPPTESNNMNFKLSKEANYTNYDTPDISTKSGSSVQHPPPGFSFIGSSELDGITLVSPKKPRSSDIMTSNVSSMDHDQRNREGYSIMGGPTNFIGGFGQYPIGDIGRFGAEQFNPFGGNNGVSLTLGLPHTENLSLSIDHHHQGFLPNQNMHLGRRVEVGDQGSEFGVIHAPITNTYENINMQNRKRLLLPDFVA